MVNQIDAVYGIFLSQTPDLYILIQVLIINITWFLKE